MALTNVPLTLLIPVQELAPGAISHIRNQTIDALVAIASAEMKVDPTQLVVRDVLPKNDLALYGDTTTALTTEMWVYVATGTTVGYVTVGTGTMGDERYVALYGVRDRRLNLGATGSGTLKVAQTRAKPVISAIKVNVGGADKVQWDISSLAGYSDGNVGVTPSPVIIPQNTAYTISYYRQGDVAVGILTAPATDEIAYLQLMGIVVERRGKLISP